MLNLLFFRGSWYKKDDYIHGKIKTLSRWHVRTLKTLFCQISEVAARAREANAEFKIDPVPGLTGVFGQIRKTRQIDGNFGNGSGSDEEDGSIIDEDEILEQQNNQKNLDDASIEDEEEESSWFFFLEIYY